LITLAPTGRGTAPDDWQILEGHRLAPAADGSLDEGDSIELVANGVVTFTVTARATDDHFTVTGEDESREWRDAWDAARPGQTIGRRGETPIDAVPRISVAVPEGREGGPAPYGMRFEVAGLQGPVAHILRHTEFHWDFEESYAFRRHPRDKRVATDARYARGPWAAHVYRTPGRYTVTLTATFAHGRTASARRTVEISDIDRVFHGRHTIVYSKRGDFSGAPSGAQRFQDLQRAVRAAQAGRSVSGPRARLLLRAGETTSLTDQLALPSLYLGRFGEGPNPIITFDLDAFSENTLLKEDQRKRDASGLTIYGIDFVGHYDAANPAMSPDPSIGVSLGRIRGNFPYITFFDVRISGLASIGRYPTGLIMANSEVTNWYDYGFIGSGRVAFVGNLMHQHPDAKVGPGAKKRNRQGQPNYADHGPMRTSSEDRLILSQNYFFSNTGWSKGGIFEFAHQPAIRTGADRGKPPGTIYVGQNHLHGGFAVYSLGVLKNAPRAAHRPLNIFAGNLVEATPGTRRLARSGE
ncbi:MAG: PKD domain-containing protein, partial [Pseudomonadota bacterium]